MEKLNLQLFTKSVLFKIILCKNYHKRKIWSNKVYYFKYRYNIDINAKQNSIRKMNNIEKFYNKI